MKPRAVGCCDQLVKRIQRKPIFFILIVALILLGYSNPGLFYFPIECKHGRCRWEGSPAAGIWKLESGPLYLVNSTGCKLMEMDPYLSTIQKLLLMKWGTSTRCNDRIVKIQNEKIIIDEELLEQWKPRGLSCCYRDIHRIQQSPEHYDKDADWGISYSNACHPIPPSSGGSLLNHSFVKVECEGVGILHTYKYVDFHGTPLHPNRHSQSTRNKASFWEERKRQSSGNKLNPPNILILGIDSISRLNMIRSLPQTRQFLLSNDFIEIQGYTKVGDNTFPNIMAGLAGAADDMHMSCWPDRSTKLDGCPLIWKNFSELNYLTAYVEDAPGICAFNYYKRGFVLQPTDYYARPLMVAANKFYGLPRVTAKSSCIGGMTPTKFQTEYLKDFISRMGKDFPYFLFSWFTSISHDDFGGLKSVDDIFVDLFSAAIKETSGDPDNTVIVFMSDHGYRFGKFRESFLGFYEDSLPFFFLRLSPSLKRSHPGWYTNLKKNEHQLASPLDLHVTLTQILNEVKISLAANNSAPLKIKEYEGRYSFFDTIPDNRTCGSATIPERYCMCGVTPETGKASSLSSNLGEILTSHVNSLLQPLILEGKCVDLKFSKFLYGREVGQDEGKNYKDYLVAVEATPSKAHFEGKIRLWQNSTTQVLGDVSRINSYQGESDCIDDFKMKMYCYCKDKLEKPWWSF